MDTVTVPRSYYVTLAEVAAQHQGMLSGLRVTGGKSYDRPGDLLGTVLCETWLIDHSLVGLVGAAYVSALRAECAERSVAPPTLDETLKAIPFAMNEARYPSVDVEALMRVLAADIPGMVGQL
ncbi:hypothetical protein D6T64_04170 [Cryobacterium melibiosiphilum]|uniref:Uncharacterized protein n=1 Tax=Cryobacterium melibiosiphilum TaxID=995039 RepID=A0A3A5MT90_9MICO|nr:hypothetical protein [Cryobacterium melibiosiphilum]RJT90348.1 hypothetical protein D6T64_04170 [Cryobacterium melibiosiphilum]